MTNDRSSERPVIVFDVLGTLVDQLGSLRKQVGSVTGCDEGTAHDVVTRWLHDVADQERAINAGDAPFAPSHELDAAALGRLAAEGVLPLDAVRPLTASTERLEPWPDTVDGLTRLTADMTVMGLSNASRRVLGGLSGSSGMRWHQALSAEDARCYKPDPTIYRAVLAAAPAGTEVPYLVAAHAWDLRAAAEVGLRTAYVPRPNGDPPTDGDAFDLYVEDLGELHAALLS